MWQILMSQTPKALNHYNVSITTLTAPCKLSNESEACCGATHVT